jgi:hypothetical protein
MERADRLLGHRHLRLPREDLLREHGVHRGVAVGAAVLDRPRAGILGRAACRTVDRTTRLVAMPAVDGSTCR